jgi:mRNA-degrading endonuclease toxin of MazEF toxin-antitoxin module
MYVVVTDPAGRSTAICCPIQNSMGGVGLTEVELKRGYTTCITKDCKVVCHDIFTLPKAFFEKKVGFIRPPEQEKIQTSLIMVFEF